MKRIVGFSCVGLLLAALNLSAADAPKKALVVTVTAGFRHSSISVAEKTLAMLGERSGIFSVDYVQQQGNRPEPPKKPAPPKPPAGQSKAKSPYEALMDQFQYETEQAKYTAALKIFEAQEKSLTEAYKTAAA